jgi:hypothetical protein
MFWTSNIPKSTRTLEIIMTYHDSRSASAHEPCPAQLTGPACRGDAVRTPDPSPASPLVPPGSSPAGREEFGVTLAPDQGR